MKLFECIFLKFLSILLTILSTIVNLCSQTNYYATENNERYVVPEEIERNIQVECQ